MTYEEFLERYLDHIEGRVDPDDVANQRPITAEEPEDPKLNKVASELKITSSQAQLRPTSAVQQ